MGGASGRENPGGGHVVTRARSAHIARRRLGPASDVLDEPATDGELLACCRVGDEQAWEILIARYERLVYSVALRNGLSVEDAADVTQTTFTALLDGIDDLRDDERLASWLMTVSRRQSWRVHERRERGEHGVHGLPGVRHDGTLAADEPTTDPIADWEHVAWVYDAVQRLHQPCRDVITALYFDPQRPSYAEVAHRQGWSIGNVGPMRARCLQRLRRLLGGVE